MHIEPKLFGHLKPVVDHQRRLPAAALICPLIGRDAGFRKRKKIIVRQRFVANLHNARAPNYRLLHEPRHPLRAARKRRIGHEIQSPVHAVSEAGLRRRHDSSIAASRTTSSGFTVYSASIHAVRKLAGALA
jgi:hypothetical protein